MKHDGAQSWGWGGLPELPGWPAWSSTSDPLSLAYRLGQEGYKAGLLATVNARRAAKRRLPMSFPAVGQTPAVEAWREGPARLWRYRPLGSQPAPGATPVLLVCSLINRPYVLDLLPERSVVERLLAAGRDVWLLDWGAPVPLRPGAEGPGLAHYALGLLPRAAAEVRRLAGAADVHVLGYCMGGTFALLAAASDRPAPDGAGTNLLGASALVLLATPVDFHDPGLLSTWARSPGLEPAAVVEAYGDAPPHLLGPAFKMMDPVGLAMKLVHLDEKIEDDAFVRFFLAMETWLEDSVAFPGTAFVEWIELYRQNGFVAAAAGRPLVIAGHRIDLGRLALPILNLIAEGDTITPPVSSLALDRLAPRAAIETRRQPGGHIGLATSTAAQKRLWPEVGAWLAAREREMTQVQQTPAPRTTAGRRRHAQHGRRR